MENKNKLSYFLNKSKSLDTNSFKKTIRIAILSSFTLNGLAETLRVKCSDNEINCITYDAGYDQYNQSILDTQSDLYKFLPQITFLFLDTRKIFGELFFNPYSKTIAERKQFIDEKFLEIKNLITIFSKSQSKLIIANLSIPTYSPYGIFESKTEYGLREMVIDFNLKLFNLRNTHPSAYVYDFNSFVTYFGEMNVFDYKQYFYGDIKISFNLIPHLADDLNGYVNAVLGISKKCIVLDLDNTLWGGVIGEDGINGIKLGPTSPGNTYVEFQKILQSLQKRGIILAINSKNNLEDALQVIRNHPYMILRENDFAIMKINWQDKSQNLKEISQELNISLDSLVFFDDDPVNQEYIQKTLPQVVTVDLPKDSSQYAQIIQQMNYFNVLNITEEDTKRNNMYIQEQSRHVFAKSSLSLDDFLEKLKIKVTILPANSFTIPRISQLTLKTNQFNLTTHRYQEKDIKDFLKNSEYLVECAKYEDKFGDNGITGAYIIKQKNDFEWIIDTFLLSCRVMGRNIEKILLNKIIEQAKNKGIKKIFAEYIPTEKNKPIENFLPENGFNKEDHIWVLNLK